MGPVRTPKRHKSGESSTSVGQDLSKGTQKKLHARKKEPSTSTLPGVQKLKSSLRQTRRLLAKDTIAADVRVETERRLKALEADLARAELSNKERAMAVRYHKVKFFERQKVVRKLTQAKRKLSDTEGSSKKKVQDELTELRVDLNYILNYPKMKKYISLFPPNVREKASKPSDEETAKTDAQREDLRSRIREKMRDGALPAEPELHLESSGRERRSTALADENEGQKLGGVEKRKGAKKDDVENDEFFGDDDEDGDHEDSADGSETS